MTELLPHFKQDLANVVLVPSGGGKFEVSVDGDLLYSKLETGEFPETRDIIKAVEAKLG